MGGILRLHFCCREQGCVSKSRSVISAFCFPLRSGFPSRLPKGGRLNARRRMEDARKLLILPFPSPFPLPVSRECEDSCRLASYLARALVCGGDVLGCDSARSTLEGLRIVVYWAASRTEGVDTVPCHHTLSDTAVTVSTTSFQVDGWCWSRRWSGTFRSRPNAPKLMMILSDNDSDLAPGAICSVSTCCTEPHSSCRNFCKGHAPRASLPSR